MPSQEDVNHQETLLTTHRRNLALYINQQSMIGAAYIPPAIANGIRDARDNIARIKGILHTWGVAVEDHPDDEETEQAAAEQRAHQGGSSPVTVNIHGGTFSGPVAQTGGSSVSSTFNQPNWKVEGNVYNIAGDLNMGTNPGKDEFLAALRQFKIEIDTAQDLPPDEADDLKSNLDAATKAIDRPQPNKDRAIEKLSTMQTILEKLKATSARPWRWAS